MRWMWVWAALAGAAMAEGERAGDFDYYVLALTWSPSFCATREDAASETQCDPARDLGWVVHGLWPQYERGWPSFCNTSARNPSRSQTAAMADVMGSSGLAWYQWKKHGRCSGLEADVYYDLLRQARGSVTPPPVLRKLSEPVAVPASVVEEAWLQSNPDLTPDMVTVTCKAGRIMETRICLTKDLEPRDCAPDVRKDCTNSRALLAPIP